MTDTTLRFSKPSLTSQMTYVTVTSQRTMTVLREEQRVASAAGTRPSQRKLTVRCSSDRHSMIIMSTPTVTSVAGMLHSAFKGGDASVIVPLYRVVVMS